LGAERYHLVGGHESGLEGELLLADIEQLLQTLAQQFHDQNIILSFCAKPIDGRNPRYAS
jgi:hypothetical protein